MVAIKIIAIVDPFVYARFVIAPFSIYARRMTQPTRVLYLPPGMLPPLAAPVAPLNTGIPFDRTFFEQVLPPAVAGFCSQVGCKVPVVELTTVDGMTHYIVGISGVADLWVALSTTRSDHPLPVQMFLPYQTIFRVEIHSELDERNEHMGFITTQTQSPEPVPAIVPPEAKTRTAGAKRNAATKKK